MEGMNLNDPLESFVEEERVLPRNMINLATVSISHVEHETPKLPKDIVKPELNVDRSSVDTKPTKLKHYDPKSLNVNTFCNIFLEGGVCLAGEENEQNKYSYQHDLIGFFDFDQEINVDLSGSKVAVNEAIKAGPGVNEKGASAFFNGDNFVTVNHYPAWNTTEMRISFWIYIIASTSDKDGMYCPLILKGYDDYKKHHFNRYPGIFIQETTRKIRAFVSLANRDKYRDVGRFVDLRASGLSRSDVSLSKGGLMFRLLSTSRNWSCTLTASSIRTKPWTAESWRTILTNCTSVDTPRTCKAARWPTTSTT